MMLENPQDGQISNSVVNQSETAPRDFVKATNICQPSPDPAIGVATAGFEPACRILSPRFVRSRDRRPPPLRAVKIHKPAWRFSPDPAKIIIWKQI